MTINHKWDCYNVWSDLPCDCGAAKDEAIRQAEAAVISAARHAIELGYCGEGSTAAMVRDALAALDELLKKKLP